jgi:membrane associated rhomboid family serine protease/Flp pilus assembly protein TadD
MANCARCGRELPSFSFGEASGLCPNCRKAESAAVAADPGGVPAGSPSPMTPRRVPYRPPFTFTLIGLNVLVFAAMVATGVPVTYPNNAQYNAQLLKWGANFGPLSLDGQPWRIFTSNYVHIGLAHLAVNMWSLWQVGRLAERIFGGWPYLLIYTACGLAGSLASLYWSPIRVSAGASGAVFGIVGALIGALYLGKLPIPKPAQQALLKNLVIVAIINLGYGASVSGIDNSAHIGGLVIGLALGSILAPQLMEPKEQRQAHERLLFIGAAVVLMAFGAYVKKVNGYVASLGSAGQAIHQGHLDQAISTLEGAVSRNPKNKAALSFLGNAYLQKKDYSKAEATLKRALQLDPNDASAKYNLGLTYAGMERYEEARQIFQELVTLDPKDDDAWMLLGASLDGLGREQEAIDAYQKAIAVNPNNAEAYRELGLAKMKMHQPAAALDSLEHSARLDPNNPETQKALGDLYTLLGDHEKAETAYHNVENLKQAGRQSKH